MKLAALAMGIWNLRWNPSLGFLSNLVFRLPCWAYGKVNLEPWAELHLVILGNLAYRLLCCTTPVVYIQRQELMGDLDWLGFASNVDTLLPIKTIGNSRDLCD